LIARPSLAAAAALAAVLCATTARAQHGHEPAAAPHGAKPAAHGAPPAQHTATPSAAATDTHAPAPPAKVPAAPKRRNATDLAKKLKEILDEANAVQHTPERGKVAAAPVRPAAPAVPRIELTWRVAVTWPTELEPRRIDFSTARITLDW
jgi:hypothetical protein